MTEEYIDLFFDCVSEYCGGDLCYANIKDGHFTVYTKRPLQQELSFPEYYNSKAIENGLPPIEITGNILPFPSLLRAIMLLEYWTPDLVQPAQYQLIMQRIVDVVEVEAIASKEFMDKHFDSCQKVVDSMKDKIMDTHLPGLRIFGDGISFWELFHAAKMRFE